MRFAAAVDLAPAAQAARGVAAAVYAEGPAWVVQRRCA